MSDAPQPPRQPALSSGKSNDREKAANPNHRDELLQRLLVNLFLAHPRKQSLRNTQANQQGEKAHEQE